MSDTLPANNGNSCPTAIDAAQFAVKIFNELVAEQPDENILISPLLLEAGLALLYLGADGGTADDLCKLLQLKSRFASNAKMANYYATNYALLAAEANATLPADAKLILANRIYVQHKYALCEEFIKIAQKYFHCSIEKLHDFAQISNALKNALTPLDAAVRSSNESSWLPNNNNNEEMAALQLLAANFKYKWFLPFSGYRSGLYDFHSSSSSASGQVKATAMLFDDDMFVKFAEFKELDARAIELPCEHEEEELSMLLLLPNKRDGLPELLQQLATSAVDLAGLSERMQMESVQVLLPKFNIDFECCLKRPLENIGLGSLFSATANFKNLLQQNSVECLPIGNVLHKTILAVHESGSEAAATAAAASPTAHKPIVISNCLNSKQKFFRADHPFYFAVRSASATLFVGQVVKL